MTKRTRTPVFLKFDSAGNVAGTNLNGTFLGPTSLFPGKSSLAGRVGPSQSSVWGSVSRQM